LAFYRFKTRSLYDVDLIVSACRPVERNAMNRKKKLNDAFNKKLKKMNAKLRVVNKPKYISKAEREAMALAESLLAAQNSNE